MVNKPELKSSGPRSAPGKGEYEFSSDIKNLPLLFWSALIVDGRMAGVSGEHCKPQSPRKMFSFVYSMVKQ